MQWRDAQLADAMMIATRKPRDGSLARELTPIRVSMNKWGEPVCYSVGDQEVPMSEADKYHDWEPKDRVDPISALGNTVRTPTNERDDSKPHRDPLTARWDEEDSRDLR